jgi:hypothetical protein
VDSSAIALNELDFGSPSPTSGSSPGRLTAGQAQCFELLRGAVASFGPPPSDLDGPGALSERRVSRSYDCEAAAIAPLSVNNVDSVSLPSGASPVGWFSARREACRKISQRVGEMVDPYDLGSSRAKELGPEQLCYDLVLRSPTLFRRLLLKLGAGDFDETSEAPSLVFRFERACGTPGNGYGVSGYSGGSIPW